eukprot:gene17540-24339_t
MEDVVFRRFSIAAVTPFTKPVVKDLLQEIDFDAVEAVINHLSISLSQLSEVGEEVVGGIIVSGSTGEQQTMSISERINLYEAAVAIANKYKIPVAAGVAATTTYEATLLAIAAIKAGCKGIMLGLPPYSKLSEPEIREYILSIKSVIPSTIPLLLYNNAVRNGYGPSLGLIAELFDSNIIWGVKHVALNELELLSQSMQLVKLSPNIRLYTGSDKLSIDFLSNEFSVHHELIDLYYSNQSFQLSNNKSLYYGLTSILGNIYPHQTGSMIKELCKNDMIISKELYFKMLPIINAALLGTSLPVGVKYAMRNNGINAGYCRKPL